MLNRDGQHLAFINNKPSIWLFVKAPLEFKLTCCNLFDSKLIGSIYLSFGTDYPKHDRPIMDSLKKQQNNT